MLVWLDGQLERTQAQPQENFGRELMELFTFGVEHYVETGRVRGRARVHRLEPAHDRHARHAAALLRVQLQRRRSTTRTRRTSASRSTRTAASASRPAAPRAGMQDGLDLINALAIHPETARRLARRLWTWFVSETATRRTRSSSSNISQRVSEERHEHASRCVRAVLLSPQFIDPQRFYQRYAWPVEFVVRALKEVGYVGFSVDTRAARRWSTWASSSSSRRTSTAGSSGRAGSRPAACSRA